MQIFIVLRSKKPKPNYKKNDYVLMVQKSLRDLRVKFSLVLWKPLRDLRAWI